MESQRDLLNNDVRQEFIGNDPKHETRNKGRVSYLLCIVIGIFGLGSWIDINGLWVQLPLLVESLPEQWTLPSYLSIIMQIANVGPLTYLLAVWLSKGRLNEHYVIYSVLATGGLACLLLAFVWDHTVLFPDGVTRSLPLLILTFFLAFVDCTSSVTFLPYMGTFPGVYLTALYIGEGCSGLVPALAALMQGVGGSDVGCHNETRTYPNGTNYTVLVPEPPHPRFGVSAFMGFLAVVLLCSLSAFTVLDCVPRARLFRLGLTRDGGPVRGLTVSGTVKVDPGRRGHYQGNEIKMSPNIAVENGNPVSYNTFSQQSGESLDASTASAANGGTETLPFYQLDPTYRCWKIGVELAVILVGNLMTNGLLPSLQSYTALPYGLLTYHLTVTLTNISNPLGCFATFVYHAKQIRVYLGLMAISLVFAVYIIIVGLASPAPPLQHSAWGPFLQVAAWVLLTLVVSFLKSSIGLELLIEGPKYLRWCGAMTQIGSLIGAIISFLLVNTFSVFKQMPACPS